MSPSPSVRYASSKDVPLILRFIRAAAEDQAPGAQVAATEQGLLKTLHLSDGTGPEANRFAWPLLIFSPNDEPAGLLIYFHNYSTWAAAPGVCLEELYVVPEYRRHGYARMLIEAMACAAKAADCVKMDWVCLLDNEKALRFYDKLGAKRMEDWAVLKVDEAGIARLSNGRMDLDSRKGNQGP
ncbi:acyl-CoA N-acyltransferase [Triangularia verruculosa]|uniref:Acyl-CoA N-acyltransferase n=1 Tax=Triangularia verruculosa TaxID=2587418 RepID=A0AAN7ASY7_9PEZI|nr:acyl-CoA N-acyltransferase [Triangularia verruculosa]